MDSGPIEAWESTSRFTSINTHPEIDYLHLIIESFTSQSPFRPPRRARSSPCSRSSSSQHTSVLLVCIDALAVECHSFTSCLSVFSLATDYQSGCLNGGRCIENTCICPAGYAGASCERLGRSSMFAARCVDKADVFIVLAGSPCRPNPCLNGGVCFGDGVRFVCSCPLSFTGETCAELRQTSTLDLGMTTPVAQSTSMLSFQFIFKER